MDSSIPSYYLFQGNTKINIVPVDHKNHYDYTEPHRHHYFELMFFETGGGEQLIDFINYEIKSKGIYLVCPGQIHLMKRNEKANGVLIQFSNELLMNKNIPWNILSYGQFIENEILFDECLQLVHQIKKEIEHNTTVFKKEIISDFLKIILLKLFGKSEIKNEQDSDFLSFITLLESKFKEWSSVSDYTTALHISSKRLNTLTKKHLGKTPLHVIHDRMLLEVKRMMVSSKDLSLKEIGYELNFESQANFSNFIKKKTGFYPTELQKNLLII